MIAVSSTRIEGREVLNTVTTVTNDPWQRGWKPVTTANVTYRIGHVDTLGVTALSSGTVRISTTASTLYVPAVVKEPAPARQRAKAPRFVLAAPTLRSKREPKEARARNGFQQLARIPCYRGVRRR